MKLNIYESDVFYHFLDLENSKGYEGIEDEDMLSEVPEELVAQYLAVLSQWKEINRKLKEIKQNKT